MKLSNIANKLTNKKSFHFYSAMVCLIFVLGLLQPGSGVAARNSERVEAGDLVSVNYVAVVENGQLVGTNLAAVANDKERKKADAYRQPAAYQPEEFLAGQEAAFPGIAGEVVGMAVGEKKQVVVPPSSAFGPVDPGKIQRKERIRRMPRIVSLRPDQWLQKFTNFPRVGDEVQLSPYYQSRVVRVTEQRVELEALVEDGEIISVPSPAGSVAVTVDGDYVVATLQPDIGAAYPQGDRIGRIVAADNTSFSVDFNPVLAGEPITVDLEVVGLVKSSEFEQDIAWLESHDQGLGAAADTGKPIVLVLYAGWCGWSQRLLDESLTDPRIKMYRDRFVWVKVNSDQEKSIKEAYDQSGYPLVVMMDPSGKVVKRIDGFRDAASLKQELDQIVKTLHI